MGCHPVFLIHYAPAFANTIVMDWNQSVQFYIDIVVAGGGIPEKDRPPYCPICGQSHQLLHRHGNYSRTVVTLKESYEIPIFVFYCPLPDCKSAFGIIPDFVEKHHQVAVDIKERVIEEHEAGTSLADIAAESEAFPGGPYSEKTLWRWTGRWDERLEQCQPSMWAWTLNRLPHLQLPQGEARPRSDWEWFFRLWKQVRCQLPQFSGIRFLHFLHRFSRSMALAAGVAFPIIGVHR